MGTLLAIIMLPFKVAYWCFTVLIWFFKIAAESWKEVCGGKKELDSHGAAKWSTVKDLKKNLEPKGWYVGKVEGRRVYTGYEKNVLLCSHPGQGKTMSMVAALLDMSGRELTDIVVNDPAGDIESLTRKAYEAKGYRAWCINIANPQKSSVRYNPLSFLRKDYHFDYERDVQNLGNLILPDDVNTRESHFQDFARLMLVATIMKLDEGETLYNAVELLSDPTGLRRFFESRGMNESLIVKQAYKAFDAAGDKERGSFMTTLARKLAGWGQKPMNYLLRDDPVTPWTWEGIYQGPKPTIIYLRAGLGTNEGAVARLILGNAINTRRRMWNKGEKFARPLRLVIDEALTIGNCTAIQDAVNELRKAKVNVFMSWLSLQSVKDTLSQSENIINGCELVIFGGGRDLKLYREVSELMGDRTIESGSRNENEHGESRGSSEQARRLIKPDELRAMAYDECAFTLGAMNVRAKKPFTTSKKGVSFQ